MICVLTNEQEVDIRKLIGAFFKNKPTIKPVDILKQIYHTGYSKLLEHSYKEDYSVAFVVYGAKVINKIMESPEVDTPFRKFLTSLSSDDTDIQKYIFESEVRKLMNLKEKTITRQSSQFSDKENEQLSNHLATIKSVFSDTVDKIVVSKKNLLGKPIDNVTLKAIEGQPLLRVSKFSKNERMTPDITRQNNGPITPEGWAFIEPLSFGNMTDYVIRQFINNPTLSYEKVKELLKTNKSLIDAFSAYTLQQIKGEKYPQSNIEFNTYFELFLDDMVFSISKLEESLKGYKLIDLNSLNDSSRFNIYSKELGLIGEIDIMAIKPDGSFKIIDIKTTKLPELQDTVLEEYNTQVSSYTHILSDVKSLKAENTSNIFLITKEFASVISPYEKELQGRSKVVVVNAQLITSPLISKSIIQEKSLAYRESVLQSYIKVSTPVIITKKDFLFEPDRESILSKLIRKNNEPLTMIYSDNEPESTPDSIRKGAEELERMFPELKGKGVRIVSHLVNSTGGQFFLDMIILAEKSNEGVAYHEGWHRFSQLYLTKEEKESLYNSVRSKNIKYTTRSGKKVTTKNAEFLDIEEFLAEEFRKFAMNSDTYKFPKDETGEIKNIFDRIWKFLKSLLNYARGNGTNAYMELFSKLYKGTYYKGNYSLNNAIFSNLNSIYKNSQNGGIAVMDDKFFREYKTFADGILAYHMTINSKIIFEYLNAEGIKYIKNYLQDVFYNTYSQLKEIYDSGKITELQKLQLSHVSSINDNFNDFIRSYFKHTSFLALREFTSSKMKAVERIIEQDESNDNQESIEEEGEDVVAPELEYDNPGNRKTAIEVSKYALRDLFNNFPKFNRELVLGDETSTDSSFLTHGKNNLPVFLDGKYSFNKTLEILEGQTTLEDIIIQLENPDNYSRFPELQYLRDKLLGNSKIEGIIPRHQRLIKEIKEEQNPEKKQQLLSEFKQLTSFLFHFTDVMTMAKLDFETVVINMDETGLYQDEWEYNFEDDTYVKSGKKRKFNPVYSRNNNESIINTILNSFKSEFQGIAKEANEERNRAGLGDFMSVYTAIRIENHFLENKDDANAMIQHKRFKKELSSHRFLYDSHTRLFHYNPYYITTRFGDISMYSVTKDVAKDFLMSLGVKINESIYEKDLKELSKILSTLQQINQQLIGFLQDKTKKILSLRSTETYVSPVEKLNEISKLDALIKLSTDAKDIAQLTLERGDLQKDLRHKINQMFPKNPVSELLFIGQDSKLKALDRYKIFSSTVPTFLNLAKLEKQYKDYYSTGSILVLDGTEYSYFRPSQMLRVFKTLEKNIHHISDLAKYEHMRHLDPSIHPQILNSALFKRMFDEKGNRTKEIMNISVLSQVSEYEEDVRSRKLKDLSLGEKIYIDFVLYKTEGSSEVRRNEASDLMYRLGLTDRTNSDKKYIKIIKNLAPHINQKYPFDFTHQIWSYIQHAAWKLSYDVREEKNVDIKKKKVLGIFDDMISDENLKKLKDIILTKGKGYNFNELYGDLSELNETLVDDITSDIHDYFENIIFNNDDSFIKDFERLLPSSLKTDIIKLAVDFKGKITGGEDIIESSNTVQTFSELLKDNKFQGQIREYIMNDFILAMEDSIFFFGDYTYYKDPIKRRKIISNNGGTIVPGKMMKETLDFIEKQDSLQYLYHEIKNTVPKDRNQGLIRKIIVKDPVVESPHVKGGKESPLVNELQEYYKQIMGKDFSKDEVYERKKHTINLLGKIEAANAAAYISLDTYRLMRSIERTWLPEHESEYKRQKLILKDKLKQPLTKEERDIIDRGPVAGFNIAKFAMTGPVFSDKFSPFKPVFDKMGLKVLLPETDWDTKHDLFEHMLKHGVDYYVYDTGSKGYIESIVPLWNDDLFTISPSFKEVNSYVEHPRAFFKNQQNTTIISDKSTLANQLRGIFNEIMVLHKNKDGSFDKNLKQNYDKFINSLKKYIAISSVNGLSELGIDKAGNFIKNEKGVEVGKTIFLEKIRTQLLINDNPNVEVLDNINVDKNGQFSTPLVSLPINREISDIVAGIIDDSFRKIKLNGSKFYQTPDVGTGPNRLKWHGLIKDENGKIIGVHPVEAKISFKKNFHNLLELTHQDGQKIGNSNIYSENLRRLNQMLKNEEWLNQNEKAIVFIGVRIPLQDMNFFSHLKIVEFLPESEGDLIITPAEFYIQLGADNDIDTITATFRYLDYKGKVIKSINESYDDLSSQLSLLRNELNTDKYSSHDTPLSIQNEIASLKEELVRLEIYETIGSDDKNLLEKMDDDFGLKVTEYGEVTFKGMLPKGTFYNFLIDDTYKPITEKIQDILSKVEGNKELQKENIDADKKKKLKKLKELERKKRNYLKGLTNDMVDAINSFLEHPYSYEYLTETDSMANIENLAKKIITIKTGIKNPVLNSTPTSLDAISNHSNIVNFFNNFSQRTQLGSWVKVRRMMTTLALINTSFSVNFLGGSSTELAKKGKNVYNRTMWTPLSTRTFDKAIDIELLDENGERITKNLSMLISTMLDLFKKVDTFPSLNISWQTIKPALVMVAQGIPLEKVVLFINNPIIANIADNFTLLGSKYEYRHAVVKTSHDLFKRSLHTEDYTRNGKKHHEMRRHVKFSQDYLSNKYTSTNNFKIDESQLEEFTKEFYKYRRDNNTQNNEDLGKFLEENPKYKDFSKDIFAFYSTLIEDGDLFYQLIIKQLDRDSVKYNNESQIALSKSMNGALKFSKFVNSDFLNRVEKETAFSPFYNDDLTLKVLGLTQLELYRPDIPGWGEKLTNLTMKLTNEVFSKTSEETRRRSSIIKAEFLQYLIHNIYIKSTVIPVTQSDKDEAKERGVTINDKLIFNKLYDNYEKDINPETKLRLVHAGIYNKKGNVKSDVNLKALEQNGAGTRSELLEDDSLFFNQSDLLLAKLPELLNLTIFKRLQSKKSSPKIEFVPTRQFDMDDDAQHTISAIWNRFSQMYYVMNISSSPSEKIIDETDIREEWRKGINFSIDEFPYLAAKLSPERLAFYRRPDVIYNISTFLRELAYYSIIQGSFMSKQSGSFSYLGPQEILSEVVQSTLDVFFTTITKDGKMIGESKINGMLTDFEFKFKEMHLDLGYSPVVRGTEGLIPEKAQSGKPYSKSHNPNDLIDLIYNYNETKFLKGIPENIDIERGFNSFVVNINDSDNPLSETKTIC